jgi:hypothetical protein
MHIDFSRFCAYVRGALRSSSRRKRVHPHGFATRRRKTVVRLTRRHPGSGPAGRPSPAVKRPATRTVQSMY